MGSWWRGVVVAGVLGAVGVFGVGGCSAPGDDGAATGHGSGAGAPAASASPSPARALTTGQLKGLLLRDGEVPGLYGMTVQAPAPRYEPRVSAKGAGCQDVLDMLVTQHASTSVIQDFWWDKERWGGRTWLAAYEGDEAATWFRRFEEGLRTCRTLVARMPEGRLDSRVTVGKAPALGDEAVAFELSMDGRGGTVATDHHVLVRVGSLTVHVSDRDAQRPPRLPVDVVVGKQLDRIARGARR